LAVLTPAAFVISPSSLNLPVDLALGVIFPLHNHVAFNYIISDYVPKATKGAARIGLVGLTVVMIAGLTKLNLTGPGITESLKGLWRKKVTEK
jgi:succinate dehydrogenase (ubiquinone) membrane anchor subunit